MTNDKKPKKDIFKTEHAFYVILKDIIDFAFVNRLAFHPTTHLLNKVTAIVKNKGICICDPNRMCPCTESLREIKINGWCKCRLYCRFDAGHHYLTEFKYIDENGEVIKKGELDGQHKGKEKGKCSECRS